MATLWSTQALNERLRENLRLQKLQQEQQKNQPAPTDHELPSSLPNSLALSPPLASPSPAPVDVQPVATLQVAPQTPTTELYSPVGTPSKGLTDTALRQHEGDSALAKVQRELKAKQAAEKELERQKRKLAKLRAGPKANTSIKRQWLSYVKNLLKPYYRNKLLDRSSFTDVCKKVIKPYDFKDVTSVPDTMHELATLTFYYAIPRLEMSRKELRSKAIQASRDLAAIGLADPKQRKQLQVKRHIYKQRLEDARRRIHECKSYKPAPRMHVLPDQSAITRKPQQLAPGELPDASADYNPTKVQWHVPPDPRVVPMLPPRLVQQLQEEQVARMKQLSLQVEASKAAAKELIEKKRAAAAALAAVVSEVTTPQEQMLARSATPARSRSRSASQSSRMSSSPARSMSRSLSAARSQSLASSRTPSASQSPAHSASQSPAYSVPRSASQTTSMRRRSVSLASEQDDAAARRPLTNREKQQRALQTRELLSKMQKHEEQLQEDSILALAQQRAASEASRRAASEASRAASLASDMSVSIARSQSVASAKPASIASHTSQSRATRTRMERDATRSASGPQVATEESESDSDAAAEEDELAALQQLQPMMTAEEREAKREELRSQRAAAKRQEQIDRARQRTREAAKRRTTEAMSGASSSSSSEGEEVGSDGERRMRRKRTKEEKEQRKLEIAHELRARERERVRKERVKERHDRGHIIEAARRHDEARERKDRQKGVEAAQEAAEKAERRRERERIRQEKEAERVRREEERRAEKARREEERKERRRLEKEKREQARQERERERQRQKEERRRERQRQREMERQREEELEKQREEEERRREEQERKEEEERRVREKERIARLKGKEKEEARKREREREKERRKQEREKEKAKEERKRKALEAQREAEERAEMEEARALLEEAAMAEKDEEEEPEAEEPGEEEPEDADGKAPDELWGSDEDEISEIQSEAKPSEDSDLDSEDYDPLAEAKKLREDSLAPSERSVRSAQSVVYMSTKYKRRIKQVKLEPVEPTRADQDVDDAVWLPQGLTLPEGVDEDEDEAFNTMALVEEAERTGARQVVQQRPRVAREYSVDMSESESEAEGGEGADSLFLGLGQRRVRRGGDADSDTEAGTSIRGPRSDAGTDLGTAYGTEGGLLAQSMVGLEVEIGSIHGTPSEMTEETDDTDDEGGINDLLLTGDLDFSDEGEEEEDEVDEDNLSQHTGSEVEGLDQRVQAAGIKKRKRRHRRAVTQSDVDAGQSSDDSEDAGLDEEQRAAKRQQHEEIKRLRIERAAQERRLQQMEWERKQADQLRSQQTKEREAMLQRLEDQRKRTEQSNTMLNPIDIEEYYEEFVASQTIRITNLQRPFGNNLLKAVLALEDPIQHFWISSNKAECYVSYLTVDGAKRLIARMDKKRWPEQGKELRIEFTDNSVFTDDGQFVLEQDLQERRKRAQQKKHQPVPLENIFQKTEATPSIFFMGTTAERVAANRRLARHIAKTLETRPDKSWSDDEEDESDDDLLLSSDEGADALLGGFDTPVNPSRNIVFAKPEPRIPKQEPRLSTLIA
uniref:RRM domain-containing protein n=1 Tax=Eutreptiella gymnastica TaxID=73025 RepID=A0A7S1HRL8_9EUGL|mmetsp:Transcript_100140/g.172910  ORF Transcript_100140/g.172910 Transcript_100140/m.172910 type:complete len:1557 (+) Transcript_100140:40-4710(+)